MQPGGTAILVVELKQVGRDEFRRCRRPRAASRRPDRRLPGGRRKNGRAPGDRHRSRPWRHRSGGRGRQQRLREGPRAGIRPTSEEKAREFRPLSGSVDPGPRRLHLARRPGARGSMPPRPTSSSRSMPIPDLRRPGGAGADRLYRARSGPPTRIRPGSPTARTRPTPAAGLDSGDRPDEVVGHPAGTDAAGDADLFAPVRRQARRRARFGGPAEQEPAPGGGLPGPARPRRAVGPVELGYLSSRKDLDLLDLRRVARTSRSPPWRSAIDRFFATRLARQGRCRSFTIETVWISVAGTRFLG